MVSLRMIASLAAAGGLLGASLCAGVATASELDLLGGGRLVTFTALKSCNFFCPGSSGAAFAFPFGFFCFVCSPPASSGGSCSSFLFRGFFFGAAGFSLGSSTVFFVRVPAAFAFALGSASSAALVAGCFFGLPVPGSDVLPLPSPSISSWLLSWLLSS